MGTPKLYVKAQELGLTQHPETVLYLSPRKVRETFTKITNNVVRDVKELFNNTDPSTEEKTSGSKSSEATFLAPKWGAFIWITTKLKAMARWSMYKSFNSLVQIRLWAPPDVTRTIVQTIIDSQEGDPTRFVKWEKMTKQYKVNEADAMAAWQPFLQGGPLPSTPVSQPQPVEPVTPAQPVESPVVAPAPVEPSEPSSGAQKFCAYCGKPNVSDAQYCMYCGQATVK